MLTALILQRIKQELQYSFRKLLASQFLKCHSIGRFFVRNNTKHADGRCGPSLEFAVAKHEVFRSSPSVAEFVNEWSHTSAFPYAFITIVETPLGFIQHFHGVTKGNDNKPQSK